MHSNLYGCMKLKPSFLFSTVKYCDGFQILLSVTCVCVCVCVRACVRACVCVCVRAPLPDYKHCKYFMMNCCLVQNSFTKSFTFFSHSLWISSKAYYINY